MVFLVDLYFGAVHTIGSWNGTKVFSQLGYYPISRKPFLLIKLLQLRPMDPFEHVNFVPFRSAMKRPSLTERVRKLFKGKVSPEERKNSPDPGQYSPCDPSSKANEYRRILGNPLILAVFRNGTCVFSDRQVTREQVIELMKTEGAVVPGTWKADFYVGRIKEPVPGTVIRYHHPNIVSFVNESEYSLSCPEHVVGAFVRLARDCDSRDLHIIHYESKAATL